MNGSIAAFILCLCLAVVLILFSIYFLIMLTDLESDYINPVDLCNKLNSLVLYEHLIHIAIPVALLLSGNYFSLAFNIPLLAYNVNRIINKQLNFDPTEIFRNLPKEKMAWGIRLGFYLISLFLYLYRMIVCLVEETNPTRSSV